MEIEALEAILMDEFKGLWVFILSGLCFYYSVLSLGFLWSAS